MAVKSAFSALFGQSHPIVLAPMAGVAGGALAAAVSRAGGLGLIGGGYCDPEWIGGEFEAAGEAAVGIGFITWRLDRHPAVLELALARRPRAVLLSFGEVARHAGIIRRAGVRLLAQVQTVRQARAARDAGADAIVAQGAEAGGHSGERATLPLVPAVVDAVAPVPVLAAGGIADGRGIAAALMLGAAGVMLGSRFYATAESLAHPRAKLAALSASGDDTVRSDVFDRLRGYEWPPGYALRTLDNATTRRWREDRIRMEKEFAEERAGFERALRDGDPDRAPVILGEAADLIADLPSASSVVERLMQQTAACLESAAALLEP